MTNKKIKIKLGRNEPCPCGSGKKYKKCCLSKNIPSDSLPSELERLKLDFSNYDQLDLIATLGGLQVYPENHSHTIRLETASRIACSIKNSGKRKIDPNLLQSMLNKWLPSDGSIGILEDPLENPFTENIVFHGGNYIVFSGITEGGSFILNILLQSIFGHKDEFPERFIKFVEAASLSVLSLSHEVASRAGYSRYMDSPDNCRDLIKVPDKSQTNKLSSSVIFTKQEINTLLGPMGLDYTFLAPFITHVGDDRLDEKDPFKNPLLPRPIVDVDNKITLALPGSITTSLRHFIWIISQKLGSREVLVKNFRETLWKNVQECLRLMSFKRIILDLPTWESNLPIEEGIFQFDTDKYAYVQFVVDDASNYKEDDFFGIWESDSLSQKMDERREVIAKWLITSEQSICKEVFLLTIFEGIGRSFGFGFNKKPDNTRTLFILAEQLKIISQLRNCDNLTLWKYAGARELSNVKAYSFLDEYTFYLDHNHSFHSDNERNFKGIFMIFGYGRALRIKAIQMYDFHAALWGNNLPHYITVCRRYEDNSIPIYFPEGGTGRSFMQLVEGYDQPIWVSPEIKAEEIPNELRRVYFEITEMFAYWLWQLRQSLRPHLKPLGSTPIQILFRLEYPESWSDLPDKNKDNSELIPTFKSKIDKHYIVFTLPYSIISWLKMRSDNQGERLILNGLMQSFSEILDRTSQCHSLDEVERKHILDVHAPLGLKKKFFFIKDNNASLNPQNLSGLRLIQEHDIEEQSDGLVKELGTNAPPIGEVIDHEKRIKLCKNIVDIYYHRLKSTLSKFAWQHLLELLIGYNEEILHHRAVIQFTIPTTIECFSDIESTVKKILKDLPEIESTPIALRVLIEIISAEPPKGNEVVSIDDLDKLLAITHHLINWAFLSDEIYLHLFDHKIKILGSDRVGIEKEKLDRVWDFLELKSLENVESAILYFKSQFELEEKLKHMKLDEYECAFKAEFGLTATQIVKFHNFLTLLGFEQKIAASSLHLSELKIKIKEELGWHSDEIEKAIHLFSLIPREKWEKAPSGFTNEDIWPWRYNRRLSYLRRPLIIGPEPVNDPIVFWGPRHIEAAGRNLLSLVENGRYKYKDSSEEMKTFIGKIRKDAGKGFMKEVKEWFVDHTDWLVDMEVPIKPGKALNSEKDLGDIDILAIDKTEKIIFSIECKNINYGRSPREIANEIERLMDDKEETDSLIRKHLKRDEWLKNNIEILSSMYHLQLESFKVYSFFLTAEEIPTSYIRNWDLKLPFVSFTSLKRNGVIEVMSPFEKSSAPELIYKNKTH